MAKFHLKATVSIDGAPTKKDAIYALSAMLDKENLLNPNIRFSIMIDLDKTKPNQRKKEKKR